MNRKCCGGRSAVKEHVTPSTCLSAEASWTERCQSRSETESKLARVRGRCNDQWPVAIPGSLWRCPSASNAASLAPRIRHRLGISCTTSAPHRVEMLSTSLSVPRSIVRVTSLGSSRGELAPLPVTAPPGSRSLLFRTRSERQYVPSSPSVTKAARCCTGGPRRPRAPCSSRSRVRNAKITARTARRARRRTGACLETFEPPAMAT
mmetsp:Transcript_31093/g.84968  ORF Transcript_31093/g.84968 Transcript_31093/m.84968 type:complete len:206 (+) Transcript_31093:171-788(+)|eukprot:scaffold142013_cov31-Tisochrysis_lutea.AAC.1